MSGKTERWNIQKVTAIHIFKSINNLNRILKNAIRKVKYTLEIVNFKFNMWFLINITNKVQKSSRGKCYPGLGPILGHLFSAPILLQTALPLSTKNDTSHNHHKSWKHQTRYILVIQLIKRWFAVSDNHIGYCSSGRCKNFTCSCIGIQQEYKHAI